ncbi:MAG: sulfotransferase [Caulobacteraceae bacterium]
MMSRFDRLFVVTYGRSGSTLLQGLLNAIAGYRVYGENGGFLAELMGAHAALADAHDHLLNPIHDRPSNPWFGASRYDPASLDAGFRRFVDDVLFRPGSDPPARVLGFKEIRHHDLEEEKLSRLLAFARRLYPRSAIIFNTRRVADVLKSGWWRREGDPDLAGRLADFAAFCVAYARANADHAIHLTYERLIDRDRMEAGRLLAFLGEALPAPAIEAVFAGGHSYQNRSLTQYLAGRAPHVVLCEPDWWRANVDEFRIEAEHGPEGVVASGAVLPSVDSDCRLWLAAGSSVVEVAGSAPTPEIGDLHPGNPHASYAGFTLLLPPCAELVLLAASAGFARRRVGAVRPRPTRRGGKGAPP